MKVVLQSLPVIKFYISPRSRASKVTETWETDLMKFAQESPSICLVPNISVNLTRHHKMFYEENGINLQIRKSYERLKIVYVLSLYM